MGTTSVRAWVALATAWAIAVTTVAIWVSRTPLPLLREQLKSAQFYSLELCVAVALAGGVVLARDLWRSLERRDIVAMTGLATLALMLTLFAAPRTHRIFYDEQIYQGIGQNLSDLRRAQMCNDGIVEYGRLRCFATEYNKQPYAYPHVLSLVYRVVGVRPGAAFAVNAVAMAATACGVYLLAWLLFGDPVVAGFAGLLVTLTPQQLLWSATAAVEPTASLACVLALVAMLQAWRSGSVAALAGAVAMTAYAVQFRPESLLILPALGVLGWRHRAAIGAWRLGWMSLLGFVLLAVHVTHLFAVRNEGWGTSGSRLSLQYLWPNLRVNGPFYFADERFPFIYTGLAVIGLAWRGWLVERAALVAYLLAFFGIDLLFYAGSYNYGADVRYSLLTYPPIAVLGGLGAARLAIWLARLVPPGWERPAVTVGLLFQFLSYAPLVRATTEEAWAARADVRFARAVAAELPPASYVLTHNPAMFHIWGINAGQMSLATVNPLQIDYLGMRYPGGVFVHWNYWCNAADPTQQKYCHTALGTVPYTVTREYRERDYRFAFYRLLLPRRPRP
ncbi:hypothetical protein LuPra_01327 [Luteitalea pratensis]|uniref:Glycosyltransferase RgtA/B/C/D-like domain-containing protein n=2 Tax=Luteitalea pratensis TaxID=1855912 RepID=A0A143PK44_LUTPR|nr:hypothetical protein LuPra_01327 [Luteitalea pratensis]